MFSAIRNFLKSEFSDNTLSTAERIALANQTGEFISYDHRKSFQDAIRAGKFSNDSVKQMDILSLFLQDAHDDTDAEFLALQKTILSLDSDDENEDLELESSTYDFVFRNLFHLKQQNDLLHQFVLNTILRMLASETAEEMGDYLNDLLLHLGHLSLTRTKAEKTVLFNVSAFAIYIAKTQSYTTESDLDRHHRNMALLESTALVFSGASLGTTHFISKALNMGATAMDPTLTLVRGGISLAEKGTSLTRSYKAIALKASNKNKSFTTYVKDYIHHNKTKLLTGVVVCAAAVTLSMLFPPLGIAMMIGLTAWSGIKIIQTLTERIQKRRARVKMLAEHDAEREKLVPMMFETTSSLKQKRLQAQKELADSLLDENTKVETSKVELPPKTPEIIQPKAALVETIHEPAIYCSRF